MPTVPMHRLVQRALAGQPVVREVHATLSGLSPPAYAKYMADMDRFLAELAFSSDLVPEVPVPERGV